MKVEILEVGTQKIINAEIIKATKKDVPLRKDGWQFTWRSLFKTEGADFYKIFQKNPISIEGILMLSMMNENMLYMNNIEIAPHNLGKDGRYDNVAGCLIAYGCLKSFELGQEGYKGYLTFESKTKLIPLYQEKYGATLTMGHRMYIDPDTGISLIKKYLNQ